ncbi:YolD-like family protein [Ureibacillus sp. GCM10028918]|uniref:YolD-like family protein n=1 Tax=Ureibacillus sp. GCM10028918 TaxID=3273429 RepID=UPI003606B2C2
MMLTEHVRDLRDWYESDFDVPEPDYDEASLNSIADDLNIAYQAKANVCIYYWSDKRVEVHEGLVVDLLVNEQAIKIQADIYNAKLYLQHIIKLDTYD